MQSVMKHSFSNTPTINAPRSKFDRSFGHKFTMDAGWLVPFIWDPVLPGDTFNLQTTIFARLATPLFPIMDNLRIETHYFFVPYRLLWSNWRKFCGEQENPADSIDFQIPVLEGAIASDPEADLTTLTGRTQALMDYLGLPDGFVPDQTDVSALPFRAYSKIYNEWFRDQNLIDSQDSGLLLDDGPDDMDAIAEAHILQRRGKRHDYFTSALPWPQKGDAVSLPLGTTAPVIPNAATPTPSFISNVTPTGTQSLAGDNVDNQTYWTGTPKTGAGLASMKWSNPNLLADLSTATAATINDLREAFQVQKLLERDARGGTRYSELVRNHFGVDFYDVSYRPEYLGGSSSPVNISPVAYTAFNSPSELYAGDLGAFGTAAISGHGFSKSFVEHGLVMGIISARADLTYQQGLNRHFSHSTRYDFYWPSLAHLGEQEILNKELYWQGTAGGTADDAVFGYQERYAEYRYKPSQISGNFRSTAAASLDPWHLSQEFSTLPVLGQTFIEEDPPIDRVIAVPTEPHFIVDTFNKLICARPMPVFGVPGMIDHF